MPHFNGTTYFFDETFSKSFQACALTKFSHLRIPDNINQGLWCMKSVAFQLLRSGVPHTTGLSSKVQYYN